MEKWFKLGGKSSAFWDPTQEEKNQFLRADQVLKLRITPRVSEAKNKGGLIELSEAEAKAHFDAQTQQEVENKKVAADKMDAADKKLEEAKELVKGAEIKERAVAKTLEENQSMKDEIETLKKRNQELEDAAAGKDTGAGEGDKKGGKKS